MTNKSLCCNCLDKPYKSLINRVLNRIINTFQQFFNSCFSYLAFLFSRVPRDSTLCFVGPSVHPSVFQSVCQSVHHTLFFFISAFFGLTAPAQMIKLPQIQPLPTRRVSGLVFSRVLHVCLSIHLSIHLSVRLSFHPHFTLPTRPQQYCDPASLVLILTCSYP